MCSDVTNQQTHHFENADADMRNSEATIIRKNAFDSPDKTCSITLYQASN